MKALRGLEEFLIQIKVILLLNRRLFYLSRPVVKEFALLYLLAKGFLIFNYLISVAAFLRVEPFSAGLVFLFNNLPLFWTFFCLLIP